MTDKKTYKILVVVAFLIAAVVAFLDQTAAVTLILIAIYCTLWAILAHMEERDD